MRRSCLDLRSLYGFRLRSATGSGRRREAAPRHALAHFASHLLAIRSHAATLENDFSRFQISDARPNWSMKWLSNFVALAHLRFYARGRRRIEPSHGGIARNDSQGARDRSLAAQFSIASIQISRMLLSSATGKISRSPVGPAPKQCHPR